MTRLHRGGALSSTSWMQRVASRIAARGRAQAGCRLGRFADSLPHFARLAAAETAVAVRKPSDDERQRSWKRRPSFITLAIWSA